MLRAAYGPRTVAEHGRFGPAALCPAPGNGWGPEAVGAENGAICRPRASTPFEGDAVRPVFDPRSPVAAAAAPTRDIMRKPALDIKLNPL